MQGQRKTGCLPAVLPNNYLAMTPPPRQKHGWKCQAGHVLRLLRSALASVPFCTALDTGILATNESAFVSDNNATGQPLWGWGGAGAGVAGGSGSGLS